jgi:hypothetical protein
MSAWGLGCVITLRGLIDEQAVPLGECLQKMQTADLRPFEQLAKMALTVFQADGT